MRSILIIFLTFLVLPISVQAGQLTGQGVIKIVNVPIGGEFAVIKVEGGAVNPAGCGPTEGVYSIELKDFQDSNRMLTTVLAAFNSHSKVAFWVGDDCTSEQRWGALRPKVYDIHVYQ